MTEALTQGRYDLVHVSAPGPAGLLAMLCAHVLELPVAGAYHTELAAYAAERASDPRVALAAQAGLAAFYGRCATVLSPSAAADRGLAGLGVPAERIARWDRGVDLGALLAAAPRARAARRRGARARPLRRPAGAREGHRAARRGVRARARARPAAAAARRRRRARAGGAGGTARQARAFHGWLEGDALATAYASADLFLFCSQTDTFGQVVLEAQASGLPVVAVDAGGPAELIADGRSGLLCPPDAATLAGALAGLAASRAARDRLARGARSAAADAAGTPRSPGSRAAGAGRSPAPTRPPRARLDRPGPPRRDRRPVAGAARVRLEPAAALAACFAAAIAASWNLLRPGVFSDDAFVHQYWMWSFRDPRAVHRPADGRAARVRALPARLRAAVPARGASSRARSRSANGSGSR